MCFVVFSLAFIALTFPVMEMKLFPTYWLIDLVYILTIAVLCFSMPLIAQEIVQTIILIAEFVILIVSASLFMSRGDVFTWPLIKQIGQVKTVSDMIKIPVVQLVIGIGIIIAFISVCVFIKTKGLIKLKQFYSWLISLILAGIFILCSGGNVIVHVVVKNKYDKEWYYSSDAYMYSTFSSSYASLQKFGFYGYYLEDLCRRTFPSWVPEIKDISELYDYDKYTSVLNGLCEDNNVVMIFGESFETFGVVKELTPVLYSMKNGVDLSENGIKDFYNVTKTDGQTSISRKDFDYDGIKYVYNNTNIYENIEFEKVGLNLTNYYSKETTDISEHKALTGCWESYNASTLTLPKLLGNYKSTYIHGNKGSFYGRKQRMDSNIGFDKALYLEDMEDFAVGRMEGVNGDLNVCSLDSVTIQHYTDNKSEYDCFPVNENFFTFFMTVTTHGGYSYNYYLDDNYALLNAIIETYPSSQDFSLIKSLGEYELMMKEYFARVLDTEYMMAYLINYLYENSILDKTIITFTGDHGSYLNAYKDLYAQNILKKSPDQCINVVEGFIYSTQIKNAYLLEKNESRIVSHITESTDLVPTILTLLGKDYDQELFMGSAVINKSVANPTETVFNGVSRSYSVGFSEDDICLSYDGSTIKSKIENYTPTQQQMDLFKTNYNDVFMKYYYVSDKRAKLFTT